MFDGLVLVLRHANTGVYEVLNSSEGLLIQFRHFRDFVFGVLVLVLRHANAGVYEVHNSSESLLIKFRPFPYFCHFITLEIVGSSSSSSYLFCVVLLHKIYCVQGHLHCQ